MEILVLTRLAAVVAAGRMDLATYFKQCAILGVSFTVAVGAVSGTEAWAKANLEKPFEVRQYSDFVADEVVELFSATAKVAQADKDPFSKSSTDTFHKSSTDTFHKDPPFAKVPDFIKWDGR